MTSDPAIDAELAHEYLRSGAAEPYQIVTLTDEEIVAVDGRRSVAPRFWYDAQPPEARRVAVAVAARGLVARGWAMGDQRATDVESLSLEATGPLRTVLGLRRAADRIVLAEQRLDQEVRARVYYLLGDPARLGLDQPAGPTSAPPGPLVLEEAVNSGGMHRFSTMTRDAAVEALAAWCATAAALTLAGGAAAAGLVGDRTLMVPHGQDVEAAVHAVVGATRVVTVLATVAGGQAPPDERYLAVYVGDLAVATAEREGGGVRLRSVASGDLATRLTEMMQ